MTASDPAEVDLGPLVAADRLLVALDFDGVIAPLQDDPTTSAPLPESAAAVEALAGTDRTVTAYVSGRSIDDLRRLTRAPATTALVGSHGAESDLSGITDAGGGPNSSRDRSSPARGGPDGRERQALRLLDEAYERIADGTPEAGHGRLALEEKPLGRTFHTRGCSPERTAYFRAELHALAESLPDLRLIEGHDIIEFGVRADTKGHGVDMLVDASGAGAALYIGDDVTDEDAFEHLAGLRAEGITTLGIKVGPGETRADVRIASPSDVAALLTRLAAERAPATLTASAAAAPRSGGRAPARRSSPAASSPPASSARAR